MLSKNTQLLLGEGWVVSWVWDWAGLQQVQLCSFLPICMMDCGWIVTQNTAGKYPELWAAWSNHESLIRGHRDKKNPSADFTYILMEVLLRCCSTKITWNIQELLMETLGRVLKNSAVLPLSRWHTETHAHSWISEGSWSWIHYQQNVQWGLMNDLDSVVCLSSLLNSMITA